MVATANQNFGNTVGFVQAQGRNVYENGKGMIIQSSYEQRLINIYTQEYYTNSAYYGGAIYVAPFIQGKKYIKIKESDSLETASSPWVRIYGGTTAENFPIYYNGVAYLQNPIQKNDDGYYFFEVSANYTWLFFQRVYFSQPTPASINVTLSGYIEEVILE